MPGPRQLRPLFAAAALTGALLAPSSALAADCPGQELAPVAANIAQVETATLCLLNAERAAAGLPALSSNHQLRTAALRHSQDMVQNDYFEHDSLDGRTFSDRIDAAGYIPSSGRWVVGENLAWGSGDLANAVMTVRGWMGSPAHRSNILQRAYAEIGIGIVPSGALGRAELPGAVYTTDFGARPDRERLAQQAKRAKSKKSKARRKKRRSRRRSGSRRHGAHKVRLVAHFRPFRAQP